MEIYSCDYSLHSGIKEFYRSGRSALLTLLLADMTLQYAPDTVYFTRLLSVVHCNRNTDGRKGRQNACVNEEKKGVRLVDRTHN